MIEDKGISEGLPPDEPRPFDEEEDDLREIREAVAEWRAGDEGLPLKDAFNEIRASSRGTD